MRTCIKILIVEDEQIVALDLKRRLTKLGYEVTGIAADGDTALALIKKSMPNIVLMDIHIQGKTDGVEVAAEIQKIIYIPVIYLTAYSEEKTLARARTTKPYGYLLKPFSERELHITIQVSMERYESDSMLKKNQEHLNLALEAAHLGTWEVKENTSEVYIGKNPSGYLEPISNWSQFFASIVDDDKQNVADAISRLQNGENSTVEIEFRLCGNAATDRWFKLYGKSFNDGHPNTRRIVGILQNTTESHHISDKLKQAAAVFKHTTEGIIILGKDRTVECANDAFYQMTGYQPSNLEHTELPFLTKHFLGSRAYKKIWRSVNEERGWRGEIIINKENGEEIYAWLNIGIVPGPKKALLRYVIAFSDITEVRKAQDQLAHLAYYDNLTDLPNRKMILDRLQHALAIAKRGPHYLAVMFIDLDNFKRVNDTMGHQVGDEMLRAISQRLAALLRESDSLGRLGGDEFVIILEKIRSRDVVAAISRKILNRLSIPLLINNTEIIPSCSIGISVYPDDSSDYNELLRMADIAMYEAKKGGRNNYVYFHPEMMQNPAHFLTRERELHRALQQNQFVLYYQPQFSLRKKKVTSVEALIRWQHPDKGMLSPAEIIPVAEASSLIIEIGNWVLTEACRQLSEWRANGLCDIRVAVNISIRQLTCNQLPALITFLLRQYKLPSHLLELEITESCLQNDDANIACLKELEKLGVSISIDDFGTGYSCMSSLKHLPIHRLKIDQTFVRDIPGDQNDCAISSAIVALGRRLNMQVIAEGVETAEQVQFLMSLGCDELQGYYFSRPVTPREVFELTDKLSNKIMPLL